MARPPRERLEDQDVERSGKEIRAGHDAWREKWSRSYP
jgi:hypothetical protein